MFENWESDEIFEEGSTHHWYLQDQACLYYILGKKDYKKLTFFDDVKEDYLGFYVQKWPLKFDYSKPVKQDVFLNHLDHMANRLYGNHHEKV